MNPGLLFLVKWIITDVFIDNIDLNVVYMLDPNFFDLSTYIDRVTTQVVNKMASIGVEVANQINKVLTIF